MAQTLASGVVIPAPGDRISASGVQEMRTLGASVDAGLAAGRAWTLEMLEGVQTAYDVAVKNGFQGTAGEWLASLVGPEGPEGPYGGTAVTDPQVASMLESGTTETGGLARSLFPSASGTTVTHYVSPTGDNATGDGTEANPFKTINYAVSLIPDVVRHQHEILLLPGEYPEDVRLSNKVSHGVIRLGGATADRSLYRVRTVTFDRVQGQAYMQNMTSTVAETAGERSFEFRGSGPMMFATNLATTPDVDGPLSETRGLLADYGSTVSVSNCDFSGKRYGVRSNYQSQVFMSDNNTGSGNHIGVATRWGGRLNAYYGGLPTGATAMSTNSGGTITLGHGSVQGDINETGLIRSENYRDTGVTSKTWLMTRETIPSTWIPDADIPSGSTVRFRFRAPADNVQYKVAVEWLARVNLTGAQSAETRSALFMRQNAFTLNDTSVVQSNGMGTNPVVVSARGQFLDFYIDIVGALAWRGEWSARVKIDSTVGKLPILAQAQLL